MHLSSLISVERFVLPRIRLACRQERKTPQFWLRRVTFKNGIGETISAKCRYSRAEREHTNEGCSCKKGDEWGWMECVRSWKSLQECMNERRRFLLSSVQWQAVRGEAIETSHTRPDNFVRRNAWNKDCFSFQRDDDPRVAFETRWFMHAVCRWGGRSQEESTSKSFLLSRWVSEWGSLTAY